MISTTAITDAFLLEPPESDKPASSSALVEEPAGLCRIKALLAKPGPDFYT